MSQLPDLLERFRRGAELLAMATTGAAGPVLDFKAEGHAWTVRQSVCHLADAEAVAGTQIRQILTQEHPALATVDYSAWAGQINYSYRKLSASLETFRRLRADNFELLQSLSEAAFSRTGTDASSATVTLQSLVEWFAEHTEEQVREIQAVRAVYKEFRAKELAAQNA